MQRTCRKRTRRRLLPKVVQTKQTHLPTIARMHCTILVFSVGLFVAYSMQVYSTIESTKRSIFREAKRIYQVRVPFQCSLPHYYATLYGSEDANEANIESVSVNQSLKRPDAIWKDLIVEFTTLRPDTSKQRTPEFCGQRMCDILIELLNHYPFPEFRGSDRTNLQFETLEEIDTWQRDVHTLRNVILNVTETVRPNEVNSVIDAYASKWKEVAVKQFTDMSNKVNMDTSRHLLTDDPKIVFDNLLDTLKRTGDIISPVRDHFNQLEIDKKRYPGKTWFVAIAIFCLLFFMITVVAPLYICIYSSHVGKTIYGLVSLWGPLFFYGALFFYLFYRLLN